MLSETPGVVPEGIKGSCEIGTIWTTIRKVTAVNWNSSSMFPSVNSYTLTLWKKKHVSHLGITPGNPLITLETKTFCLSCVNHTNQFGQAVSLHKWIPVNKWRRKARTEDYPFASSSYAKALGNHHQDTPPKSEKADKWTLGASCWKDTCHQWVLSKNRFWIRTGLKILLLVRKCRAQSRTRNIMDLSQSLLCGEPEPRPQGQSVTGTTLGSSLFPRCLVACCLQGSPHWWPHGSPS